ncbi:MULTISPECIES: hypothetical protein [Amycolatopsis]|uniref:Uncharacterized protein n=2 Tax=Amycolatopsis TaxID=1813 RepID=A0A1I3WQ55_9PSEU|nr:hypothetical protein [Amycolatopsis sacchari]SFK08606.1 hypothetical protein SAMN05421835_113135 [Amycolatopsis sacchari]
MAVSKTVSTTDGAERKEPAPVAPDPVLDQLVSLTRSISDLVRQNAEVQDTTTTAADADEQARVVFAYDFLGVVLGRRAPSVFQLTKVTVTRKPGTLTFTGLGGATAAKIRAANNVTQLLQGLAEGVPVRIDQGANAIQDDQRIDSIVTFTAVGGLPVALGPCLDAVSGPIVV